MLHQASIIIYTEMVIIGHGRAKLFIVYFLINNLVVGELR